MINFVRNGNTLSFNLKLPKIFFKKKVHYFNQYYVTYIRPNGQYVSQMRDNLPRVVDFNQFEDHDYYEYIGCYNGLGWKIISIKLVECRFRS